MSCLILAQEPIRLSLDLATPTPTTLPAAITLARSNNQKEASSRKKKPQIIDFATSKKLGLTPLKKRLIKIL